MLGEDFESFAASGFNEGGDEELIHELHFPGYISTDAFHQSGDVFIIALPAYTESPSFHFPDDHPEMSPFLGNHRTEHFDNLRKVMVSDDQRDAGGRGFLLAPGMVGKDLAEVGFGHLCPARIGRQLKSEGTFINPGAAHHG